MRGPSGPIEWLLVILLTLIVLAFIGVRFDVT